MEERLKLYEMSSRPIYLLGIKGKIQRMYDIGLDEDNASWNCSARMILLGYKKWTQPEVREIKLPGVKISINFLEQKVSS